jgi:hypothetical protein
VVHVGITFNLVRNFGENFECSSNLKYWSPFGLAFPISAVFLTENIGLHAKHENILNTGKPFKVTLNGIADVTGAQMLSWPGIFLMWLLISTETEGGENGRANRDAISLSATLTASCPPIRNIGI